MSFSIKPINLIQNAQPFFARDVGVRGTVYAENLVSSQDISALGNISTAGDINASGNISCIGSVGTNTISPEVGERLFVNGPLRSAGEFIVQGGYLHMTGTLNPSTQIATPDRKSVV